MSRLPIANPLLDVDGEFDPVNLINPYAYAVSGPPAVVGSVKGTTNSNEATTSAISTVGASLLMAFVSYYDPPVVTPVLSDSAGNTWAGLTVRGTDGTKARLYYCSSPSTSASHTFSATGTTCYPALLVVAWSGFGASPFDVENGNSSTGSSFSALSSGSVTPSQNNSVVISALSFRNSAESNISIGSGFTEIVVQGAVGGACHGAAIAYKTLTSIAAENPSWSTDTYDSGAATVSAVFKY